MLRILEGQDDEKIPETALGPMVGSQKSSDAPSPAASVKAKAPSQQSPPPKPVAGSVTRHPEAVVEPAWTPRRMPEAELQAAVNRLAMEAKARDEWLENERRRRAAEEMATLRDCPELSPKVQKGCYGNAHIPIQARTKEILTERAFAYQKALMEKEAQDMEQATFEPQISSFAKALGPGRPCAALTTWNSYPVEREQRILKMREERLAQDMRECNFTPEVNPRSKHIMRSHPDSHVDVATRLHRDAMKRQEKHHMLVAAHTPGRFAPTTNNNEACARSCSLPNTPVLVPAC